MRLGAAFVADELLYPREGALLREGALKLVLLRLGALLREGALLRLGALLREGALLRLGALIDDPPRLGALLREGCATTGIASASAVTARIIAFEVFMVDSFLFGFVFWCKITNFPKGIFRNHHIFFPINLPSSRE